MADYDLIKINEFAPLVVAIGDENVPLSKPEGGTYKMRLSLILSQLAVVPSDIVNNLWSTDPNAVLSANQGRVLYDIIKSLSGTTGSGIIGQAFPDTVPISSGFGIYTAGDVGTYINFLDSLGVPIEVTQSDLDSGLVQLWGTDGVWTKNIIPIEGVSPVFSNNLSDI